MKKIQIYDTTYYSWDQELYTDRPFQSNTKWVPWGKKGPWFNNYPGQIDHLYTRSSTLKVVVDRNAAAIAGEGFYVEGANAKINGGEMSPQEFLDTIGFDSDLLQKIAYDLSLYNGISIRVVLNRSESVTEPNKIIGVYHTRFSDVRVGAPETPQSKISKYWYTPDWGRISETGKAVGSKNEPYEPKCIYKFGEILDPNDSSATRLIYEYIYSPISDFYPFPDVSSCFDALELGVDIIDFQKSYIANGMTGSAIMKIPYVSSDPSNTGSELNEIDKINIERKKKEIIADLTGKTNAGRIAIIFYNPNSFDSEGKIIGLPEIEKPVESSNDKKFIEIQQEVRQTVTTGLNIISGELFGIPSAGGFSSQSELLLTANELHYNLVIKPKQKIIEKVISKILSYAGFKEFEISIKQSKPIERGLTIDLVEKGIITPNEYRKIVLGLEPISENSGTVSLPAKSRLRKLLQMLSN